MPVGGRPPIFSSRLFWAIGLFSDVNSLSFSEIANWLSCLSILHLVGQVFALPFNSCAGWSSNGRQRKSEKS